MKIIQTVAGAISPDKCSMVLSHEHLFIDLTNQAGKQAPSRPLTAADYDDLMRDPYALRDNLLLNEFDCAAAECRDLAAAGCNTVVDCTTYEIGRDPELLKRLSQESNTNIVMGCGFYTADTHKEDFLNASVEEATDKLLEEISCGINGVKPGIIGEIGTSKTILPSEYKALKVAAAVQRQSGLAVQVHIYPWADNGLEASRVLIDNGADPAKIVVCHSDVELDMKYIFELLKMGVYVEIDNIGKEFVPDENGFAGGRFAKDTERAVAAAEIINKGFGSQLLITNDICLKCMIKKYGGRGYTHLFNNIVPMKVNLGIPADYIKQVVLRENPLKMLAIDARVF
jgi:phosphotriesterase-related protein